MSRADVFRLLDDGNNRGDLITAVHGERVDFMDSLDSNDDAEDDINDEFAYGKQLMAPWKLYCALTSGSFLAVTYFLMDLLGPLKNLSLLFQRDSLAFSDIAVSIRKAKRTLKTLAGINIFNCLVIITYISLIVPMGMQLTMLVSTSSFARISLTKVRRFLRTRLFTTLMWASTLRTA